MAGSTLPQVRTWLVQVLKSHPNLVSIPVHYVWTDTDDMGRLFVAIGYGTDGEVIYPTLRSGRLRREERYTLRVHCVASEHGMTPQIAHERAAELLEAVHETVADNAAADGVATASDQQVIAVTVDGVEMSEGPGNEGWSVEYVVSVGVRARLL